MRLDVIIKINSNRFIALINHGLSQHYMYLYQLKCFVYILSLYHNAQQSYNQFVKIYLVDYNVMKKQKTLVIDSVQVL